MCWEGGKEGAASRRICRMPTEGGGAERQGRREKGPRKRPVKSQLLDGLFPIALFVPVFCPGH